MNQIDKIFSKGLNEHSTATSERVNDLFRQRLAQRKVEEQEALMSEELQAHVLEPSSRADQLFKAKLEKRHKKVFWTTGRRNFAAAAGLVLILGIGYLQLSQPDKNPVKNNGIAEVTTDNTPKASGKINENTAVPAGELRLDNPKLNVAADVQRTEMKVKTVSLPYLGSDDNTNTLAQNETLETVENVIYNEPVVAINLDAPRNTEVSEDETLIFVSRMDGDETVALGNIETETLQDSFNESNIYQEYILEPEEQRERTLTAFYEEVKHLKKGQHVDLSKYGFKSLDELTLNEEGFILTEVKKIKNTVNWIKAKLIN
jgi:hypothetical protein